MVGDGLGGGGTTTGVGVLFGVSRSVEFFNHRFIVLTVVVVSSSME